VGNHDFRLAEVTRMRFLLRPIRQKNNTSDRDIMQKIRKSIVDDKTLSTYAHNVKIVAQGGKVTLKGPVRSAEEKQTIEQKATEVAGAGNVTNELTIKASRSKTK
jgi:hyperosmotically inducible protein